MSSFNDVIGYEEEKKVLLRVCDVLKNVEKYRRLGAKMPQSILLYGPPGTGKTTLAKAFIAESGRACIVCRKDKPNGNFVESIKKCFDDAVACAPSILFLDDVDKFAENAEDSSKNKEEFIVIQSCMEECKGKDVFVFATANNEEYLPKSLVRAGRFGHKIKINLPYKADAIKIFEHYLKDKNVSKSIKAEDIAALVQRNSCAFLEEAVNSAIVYAVYDGREQIELCDMKNAVMDMHHGKLLNRSVDEATERRIAYHEAGHATVALALGVNVNVISIEQREECSGFCTMDEKELEKQTLRDFENVVTYTLGAKATTEHYFGESDLGCGTDMDNIIYLVTKTVSECGLRGIEHISSRYRFSTEGHNSDVLRESKEYIHERYLKAREIVAVNGPFIDALVSELLKKKVLLVSEIDEIQKRYPIVKPNKPLQ